MWRIPLLIFSEDLRLCKSMLADGWVSEFDFLDDKVDTGMGWTTPSVQENYLPLQKKLIFFISLGAKFIYCNVGWLLEWKDLGYEHATWELESSSSKVDKVWHENVYLC